MKFFSFLGKLKFYKHLGIAIVVSVILYVCIFVFLNIFTRHAKIIIVPDFYGSSLSDIKNENLLNEFEFIITDSVYDISKEKGSIIQQNPLPYSKVKKHRKIYLTVVAGMTEKIFMPNLVDLSLRQALATIEISGLQLGYLDYIQHFAENAVLEQVFRGEIINPDTLIEKRSKIDLVLGTGNSGRKTVVPLLIAKKQKNAIKLINQASFNIGKEYYLDGNDTANARIYKQEPAWDSDSLLNHGDFVNVWYRSDLDFDFDELLESMKPDTLNSDTLIIDEEDFEDIDFDIE